MRFSTLFPAIALAAVVVAAPGALEARQSSSSSCNTGPIQCCTTTYSSENSSIIELLGMLGIVIPTTTGSVVGVGCSPVTGAGSSTGAVCDQQPVCCNGNTFVGSVVVGCSPITINS